MTTRAEHLAWTKERALEYVAKGDLAQAHASLCSDLRKHPDTMGAWDVASGEIGLFELVNGTPATFRRFVEGFQ